MSTKHLPQPVANVRLGDHVERKCGGTGIIRALAWIDDGVYLYYREGGAERFEPDDKVLIFEDERETPHHAPWSLPSRSGPEGQAW